MEFTLTLDFVSVGFDPSCLFFALLGTRKCYESLFFIRTNVS